MEYLLIITGHGGRILGKGKGVEGRGEENRKETVK